MPSLVLPVNERDHVRGPATAPLTLFAGIAGASAVLVAVAVSDTVREGREVVAPSL